MTKLTLTNYINNITIIENDFIDRYLAEANGEFVKVYLVLKRHMNEPTGMLSVIEIADLLECTESDVKRALNYWQKKGLLDFSDLAQESKDLQAPGQMTGKADTGAVSSSAAVKTAAEEAKSNIRPYRTKKNHNALKELLFVTETYFGRPLSHTDVETINYFYDELGMSSELIEYLIEYCVENDHKSMHYIQSVALAWHEQGVKTVQDAKASSSIYNQKCYSVLNAFGIRGRAPGSSEVTYMKRWYEEYGFSMEMILEACNRTISAIHQPSFDYADSILKSWKQKGITNQEMLQAADESYKKEKERKKKDAAKPKAPAVKPTGFSNFEGRDYDMAALEKLLIQQ
ncbi:MAG: DnaD domain protein [Dorea sp.]|nr:DnaD domain protein [Dorea sp.]